MNESFPTGRRLGIMQVQRHWSSDSHHPHRSWHAEELTGPASLRELSWTFIFISSWTVLLSSFTVHNEKGWQKPQNSARRFSSLVFFGLRIQGGSFFRYLKVFPSLFWVKLLNYQLCSWQQLMKPENVKLHGTRRWSKLPADIGLGKDTSNLGRPSQSFIL